MTRYRRKIPPRRKLLAHVSPTTTAADTRIYTAPSATTISSIYVCNRNTTTPRNFNMRVLSITARTLSGFEDRQLLFNNVAVDPNDTLVITSPLVLEAGMSIWVRPTATDLSFSVWGREG